MTINATTFQTAWTPGVRFALASTLCFAVLQACVKKLGHLHAFELVFFRAALTVVPCLVLLWKKKVSLLGKRPMPMLLRSIYGIVSLSLFFMTIQRMPYGAAVSLKYLSPVFTALLAVLVLSEKVRAVQWLFFALAFSGVVLLKGFDPRIDPIGLGLGVAGAFFNAVAYVSIRRIGNSEHPLVIVNYFMLTAAIVTGLLSLPFWKTPALADYPFLLFIGISGFFAQLFMTKALQQEHASKIAPLKYCEVIFALLIGFAWFGEGYHFFSLIGIALIAGGMFSSLIFQPRKQPDIQLQPELAVEPTALKIETK